jgi:hypothetical protein
MKYVQSSDFDVDEGFSACRSKGKEMRPTLYSLQNLVPIDKTVVINQHITPARSSYMQTHDVASIEPRKFSICDHWGGLCYLPNRASPQHAEPALKLDEG